MHWSQVLPEEPLGEHALGLDRLPVELQHRPAGRARSHYRFAPPLIHFTPYFANIFGASLSEAAMRPHPTRRRGRTRRAATATV
jgi:hypothetical protein